MRIQLLAAITVFTLSLSSASAQTESLLHVISKMDSTFFHAYNNCDLKTQEAILSDSIEFYHDKTGLSTSKPDIIANTKKYICNKVTRTLVKGSIEVSPIPGYGAVEIGSHSFRNNQEKDAVSYPSKFVIIWKFSNNKWTITRVISLHA